MIVRSERYEPAHIPAPWVIAEVERARREREERRPRIEIPAPPPRGYPHNERGA